MKSLFLLGTITLAAVAQVPQPFDRTGSEQVQRLNAPAHVAVSSLIQDQHTQVGSGQFIEN